MAIKNPYHKRLRREWRWGGLSDEQARIHGTRATLCGVICHSVATSSIAGGHFVLFYLLASSPGNFTFIHLLMVLGGGAAALTIGLLGVALMKIESALETASEPITIKLGQLVEESAAVKEWMREARWSGRSLRAFDLIAAQKLADLERRGLLIGQQACVKLVSSVDSRGLKLGE